MKIDQNGGLRLHRAHQTGLGHTVTKTEIKVGEATVMLVPSEEMQTMGHDRGAQLLEITDQGMTDVTGQRSLAITTRPPRMEGGKAHFAWTTVVITTTIPEINHHLLGTNRETMKFLTARLP